jgi:hypothetical protein
MRALRLRSRLKAAAIHSLGSALVAAILGIFVFAIWYPGIYRPLAGGTTLYALVTCVDLTLGPVLTFVVFNISKPRKELFRDIAIIVALQVCGLAYGTYTVFEARPIALVLEVGRFRLVTPANIRVQDLPKAAPAYRALPLLGPRMLATRASRAGEEQRQSIFEALAGFDVGQRPTYWRDYDDGARETAWAEAKPVEQLLKHYPDKANAILARLSVHGLQKANVRFLPVIARGDWTAILDRQGTVRLVLPLDGFF